jgi:hypothetical protein
MPKKRAPKKIVIRVGIVPLSLLKKRLTTAQIATASFESAHKDLKWSTQDAAQHRRLISEELNASILVTDHSIRRGESKR